MADTATINLPAQATPNSGIDEPHAWLCPLHNRVDAANILLRYRTIVLAAKSNSSSAELFAPTYSRFNPSSALLPPWPWSNPNLTCHQHCCGAVVTLAESWLYPGSRHPADMGGCSSCLRKMAFRLKMRFSGRYVVFLTTPCTPFPTTTTTLATPKATAALRNDAGDQGA